jgi:hypothetical protein
LTRKQKCYIVLKSRVGNYDFITQPKRKTKMTMTNEDKAIVVAHFAKLADKAVVDAMSTLPSGILGPVPGVAGTVNPTGDVQGHPTVSSAADTVVGTVAGVVGGAASTVADAGAVVGHTAKAAVEEIDSFFGKLRGRLGI